MPSKIVRILHIPAAAQSCNVTAAIPTNGPHCAGESGPRYISSGSDHEPSSVCLASMVKRFMENDGAVDCTERFEVNYCMRGVEDRNTGLGQEPLLILEGLVRASSVLQEKLQDEVSMCLKEIHDSGTLCRIGMASPSHACMKRIVMKLLRDKGYNAGICKCRWDHSCGIPAGDYEFIDVMIEQNGAMTTTERLIVDIDFHAQFEIARPTDDFLTVWKLLPSVFVGKLDKLKQIVCIMSESTKRSLRSQGLHLPPWRKLSYMNAKWFSPYKRTCNDAIDTCGQQSAFTGIAVRGCCLNAPCTDKLDMLYHEAGTKFQGRKGDEITVFTTEWQLPVVVGPRRPFPITGFSSLLQVGISKQVLSSRTDQALARVEST